MKKYFLLGLVSSLSLVLSGCGVNGYSSSHNGKLERWTTFNGKTISLQEMGDKQSTVYFYREKASAGVDTAINVFVDGDYLASLLKGGYRAAVICSTGERLLPSFTRNTSFADRDTGIDYNFNVGETAYVKVLEDAQGLPVFQRVSNEEGASAVRSLRQQTQTLPRVKPNKLCDTPVVEKITLQAHSLFKFDKSSYRDMLPEGKQEIADVAEKIKAGQFRIDSIKVIGYTDPMGSERYNIALSKRRAATIKSALQSAGINVPIQSQGLGKSNLLVRDCLQKYKNNAQQRMACDQPNRRVEIIIYGESL